MYFQNNVDALDAFPKSHYKSVNFLFLYLLVLLSVHPALFLQFSRKFYVAQWFRDTTMETEKAIKSQKDEDSSEGTHHAKDVETTGQIMHRAESRKKFLRSIIKTAPSQFSTLKYVSLPLTSLLAMHLMF